MEKQQLKSFKKLTVWQKAVDLAVFIYSVTEKFPKSELYGITNQMRRSAVSISSNIAEGFKRNHNKEKTQFYNIAYGSVAELESQIEVSLKLNFLNNQDYQNLISLVIEVGKMLDGLIKSVNRNSSPKSPSSYILTPIFFFLFLSSIFYILNPFSAFAAEISFDAKTTQTQVGEQFKIDLIIDTEQKSINAFEGRIAFPSDLIEIKEVRDGNSIVNFWIERPSITSKSYILYSGITPGGFSGQNGLIFSLIFESLKEGQGAIEIQNTRALLNDGLGTESSLTVNNLEFRIQELRIADPLYPKPYILAPIEDIDPPDSFTPKIANDPALFDGKHFLVFATQDKGAGISHYEIKEAQTKKLRWLTRWRVAESPYVLQDQDLRSYIFVKAVDNARNERIEIIAPQNPLRWYESMSNWAIILLIVIIVIIIIKLKSKNEKDKMTMKNAKR